MCCHLFTLHLSEENMFFSCMLHWGSYFPSELNDILQKEKNKKWENQNKNKLFFFIFYVDWNIMLKLA